MIIKIKKAQEEIVGFALIIIVVAVILLVFIGFSLKSPQKEAVESYEAESFVQVMLQYTTNCTDNLESLSVQKLIFKCENKETCLNGEDSCKVLDSTLKGVLNESWPVSKDTPIKGYELNITSNSGSIEYLMVGNNTINSKSSAQYLQDIKIFFTAYY